MSRRARLGGAGDDLTPESAEHDWKWRRKVRSNRHSHMIYRLVVGAVGLIIVVLGLIMVPLPGQGWLVVLVGLAVLASEFDWAKRLLQLARGALQAWTGWLLRQPWWVKGLVALITAAAAAAFCWLALRIGGVPGYLPALVQQWLTKVPGLAQR
jgi:uncharacterized protein (TIGR02611 family)